MQLTLLVSITNVMGSNIIECMSLRQRERVAKNICVLNIWTWPTADSLRRPSASFSSVVGRGGVSGLYIMWFHYIRVVLHNVIALAAMNKLMIFPVQLSVFHFDIKHAIAVWTNWWFFWFNPLSFLPWYNRTGWLGIKHQLTYLLSISLWHQTHLGIKNIVFIVSVN